MLSILLKNDVILFFSVVNWDVGNVEISKYVSFLKKLIILVKSSKKFEKDRALPSSSSRMRLPGSTFLPL